MKLLAAFSLLAMVVNAISTEYGSVSFTPENGVVVPMEMILNKHSMLSIPSKPKNYKGCFDRTINFHDFDKGLVALKEVQGKKCLVKPTGETYEQNRRLLKAVKSGRTEPVPQGIEKWTIPKNPVPAEQVVSQLGEKIAEFCSDHQVYRLEQRSVLSSLRSVDRDMQTSAFGCSSFCGFCSLVMEKSLM